MVINNAVKIQSIFCCLHSLNNSWISFTPCSEENVYLLCKELIRSGIADPAGTDLYVVFISNEEEKVILSYLLYFPILLVCALFFYCFRSLFLQLGLHLPRYLYIYFVGV